MHDAGGGEALRVVLEERASACVTVVGAIATVLYSITRETPKVSRCIAANRSRSLVDQEVDPSLAVVDGVAVVAVMLRDIPSARLGLARLLSHVSATFLLFFCTTPLQLSQNSRKSS